MVKYASGTRHLTDTQFVHAFETCTLANESFRHYDHIRLVWIYARAHGREAAMTKMVTGIRRFAIHHNGDTLKYHDTITRLWVRLVLAAMVRSSPANAFHAFADANPELLEKRYPLTFYSDAVLMSTAARARWVEPDLRPLPDDMVSPKDSRSLVSDE
jgi:hypothetical protein